MVLDIHAIQLKLVIGELVFAGIVCMAEESVRMAVLGSTIHRDSQPW